MATEPRSSFRLTARSRVVRTAAWLRARPWGVFLGALAIDLLLMVFAHLADWHDTYIGVPAAITSFVVISGALVGGPYVGAALGMVAGVAFDTLVVTDQWLVTGVASGGVVVLVWLLGGVFTGMLGDRYRAQVAASLQEATEAREAVQKVLSVTPTLHASGDLPTVARAVCDAVVDSAGCTVAALAAVDGDTLQLVAQSPGAVRQAATPQPLGDFPDLEDEILASLEPSFVADLAARGGRSLLTTLAGYEDVTSVLRIPLVIGDRPAAVLALGWSTAIPHPDAAWLATMQRFADHAAVALERARRLEAERDSRRLYRRFEVSLIPQLDTDAEDLRVSMSYSPGERRMRLGGDFVDLVTRSDGSVRAVIGDVAGHGPDAAAFGAFLRAAWHALALRDLDAASAMGTLNRLVVEESDRAEADGRLPVTATACLFELSADRLTGTFVTAGHPPALLLTADDIVTMPIGGPPLGIEDSEWRPVAVDLPATWTLLLYTDGIIEAHAGVRAEDRLGIDGLMSLAGTLLDGDAPTDADLRGLLNGVRRINGGPLRDDATLAALSRAEPALEALVGDGDG